MSPPTIDDLKMVRDGTLRPLIPPLRSIADPEEDAHDDDPTLGAVREARQRVYDDLCSEDEPSMDDLRVAFGDEAKARDFMAKIEYVMSRAWERLAGDLPAEWNIIA